MTISTETQTRIGLAEAGQVLSFGYENAFSVRVARFIVALDKTMECKDASAIDPLLKEAGDALRDMPEKAFEYLRENADWQRVAVLWTFHNTLDGEGDADDIQEVGDFDSDVAYAEGKECLDAFEKGELGDANLFAWQHFGEVLDNFASEAVLKENERAEVGESSARATGKDLLDTMAAVVGVRFGEPSKADAWHSFRGCLIDFANEAVRDAFAAFPGENAASDFLSELSDAQADYERGLSAGVWNELCLRLRDNAELSDLREFLLARYGASVEA